MSLEEAVPGNRPIDPKQLGDLMDGRGEVAGALVKNERQGAMLLDQLRFQHEVLADIFELSDPRSTTPHLNMQIIRIKTSVALRAAAQSGLLS